MGANSTLNQPLPIDPLIPEILAAVRSHASVLLTASPGAGKSTRLPPELLSVVSGNVIVLQPRRMAAVSAAHRIASERGWRVGQEVGYHVRFEKKQGPKTRLQFMTDATLLRRMLEDPELRDVDLVVLDEFHERHLNQDLLLGAVRELQELGREIKLLLMSATLEEKALKAFLPGAPFLEVPGRVFPLEVRYSRDHLSLRTDRDFYSRVSTAVQSAARETKGDILVFLPGTGEIRRVQEQLQCRDREVVALHGSLPLSEQTRVLAAHEQPRVILATNVAEASVTVQGVDFVIDSGLAKEMVTNLHSGFSSLELGRISQFSARQRAGRAARERAGVALRLWTPHEEQTQPVTAPPECLRADLTQALLWLAHLGVRDFSRFAWLDVPSSQAFGFATRALRSIGALTTANELTARGRELIRFPLPPRGAAILLEAEAIGEKRLGARVAAILNERDFLSRETTTFTECDVTARLQLLQERPRGAEPVLQAAEQLEGLMRGPVGDGADPRPILLSSQRDRLCRRRENSARGLMIGGRGVRLEDGSQVKKSEFFLALSGVDLPGQSETLIRISSGFSKAQILKTFGESIRTEESVEFVEEKQAFFKKRVRVLDGLPLEEATLTPVDAVEVQTQLAEILLEKWKWLATQNKELGEWLARWDFLCRILPEYADALSRDVQSQTLSLACFGKKSVGAVIEENLVGFLEMSLPADTVQLLSHEVPETFLAPSGVRHPIEYLEVPYVDVRLQEIFGLLETPRIVSGRVPIVFRLLAPNFRPVQITADLGNFWAKGYQEVRRELRARYPKHSWPEDPYTARPEAKGRRR